MATRTSNREKKLSEFLLFVFFLKHISLQNVDYGCAFGSESNERSTARYFGVHSGAA